MHMCCMSAAEVMCVQPLHPTWQTERALSLLGPEVHSPALAGKLTACCRLKQVDS